MAFSLKELNKIISEAALKDGKSLIGSVRELEEETSGVFIAFVDDKSDSYDVMIKLDTTTGDIVEHACDCESSELICSHKAAIMLSFSSDKSFAAKNTTIKKVRKTKLTEQEILISESNSHEIIQWLSNRLQNDKTLWETFKLRFGNNSYTFQKDEIEKQVDDVIKSVVGRRKKFETAEATKIIETLQPYANELMLSYAAQCTDPNINESYVTFYSLISDLHQKLKTSSKVVVKFLNELSAKFEASVLVLQPFEVREWAINVKKGAIKPTDKSLVNIMSGALSLYDQEVNEVLFNSCIGQIINAYFAMDHLHDLLMKLADSELMPLLISYFPDRYYSDNYNSLLADCHLRVNGHMRAIDILTEAQKRANSEASRNRLSYKIADILDEIGSHKKALKLRIQSLSPYVAWKEYYKIADALANEPAEVEKIRKIALLRPRNFFDNESIPFLTNKFKINLYHESFNEALKIISEYKIDFDVLEKDFSKLYNFNPDMALSALVNMVSYNFRWNKSEINQLVAILKTFYSDQEIKNKINKIGVMSNALEKLENALFNS